MDLHAGDITTLSICSGGGGLDLGLELAIPGARPVCYVEGEAFCVAGLVEAMHAGALADAPVWSDVRTFDGRPWRGIVDCVVGGFPCQPFSFAGKRGGSDDPRHLWPSIARIVAEVEPAFVFFENVGGHLTLGFDAVRADLRRLGFRVAAGLFTAEEVGAPHRRERLFILGVADAGSQAGRRVGDGRRDQQQEGREGAWGVGGLMADRSGRGLGELRESPGGGGQPERDGGAVADAQDDHRRGGERGAQAGAGEGPERRGGSASGGGLVADADEPGRAQRGGEFGDAGEEHAATQRLRGERVADASNGERKLHTGQRRPDEAEGDATGAGDLPLFPPGPGDLDAWRRILDHRPDLTPAVEPGVRGVAHGMAARLDQLRMLGNGVVPLEAAYAFVSLWACLHGGD